MSEGVTDLLRSKGDDWIDFRSAPGGTVAGEQCHSDESNGNTGERQRVAWPDAVKDTRHQTRNDHAG